jgi:hypothetical protein
MAAVRAATCLPEGLPEDLDGVPDADLRSWMAVLDRRLIFQADEPHPEDVASYMRVWNELKRREGEPPTDAVLTGPVTEGRTRDRD